MELREAYEAGALARGSIAELVDDWLQVKERQGRSPTTLVGYSMWAKRIADRFGTSRASALTGRDVQAWYNALQDGGMSPASIRHAEAVLRAILTFGHKFRELPTVATAKAQRPEHRQQEIVIPTNEEVRRAVDLLRARGEWGRAVELLAHTGLRRGEVCGLRWEDWRGDEITVRHSIVKPTGRPLTVKETKGKRSREVQLDSGAVEILERQREHLGTVGASPWVFPNWRADVDGGVPRTPSSLGTAWTRLRALHGLDHIGLHSLRHWYATTALDAGAPPASVADQLGHAQVSTTLDLYAHSNDEGRRRVAAAIDHQFRIQPPQGETT